jgi:hypothetical protein
MVFRGFELIPCGYNTPAYNPHIWSTSKFMSPEMAKSTAIMQHKLVMQTNSYMNSCFSIATSKAGLEDGKYELELYRRPGRSEGQIPAEAVTTDDEVICAD